MTVDERWATDEQVERVVEALHEVRLTLESLRACLKRLVEAGEDHEQRLRVIERWKHNLTPVIAALTFVLGALFTTLVGRLI